MRHPTHPSYALSLPNVSIREWKGPANNLHRVDGPAREESNGTKEWYLWGRAIMTQYHNGVVRLHQDGLPHLVSVMMTQMADMAARIEELEKKHEPKNLHT